LICVKTGFSGLQFSLKYCVIASFWVFKLQNRCTQTYKGLCDFGAGVEPFGKLRAGKEKNVACEACGQPKMFNFAFGFGKLAE
jgi:hypothetical protein